MGDEPQTTQEPPSSPKKRSRKKIQQATPPAPVETAPPVALVKAPTEQELLALQEKAEADRAAEELQKLLFYGDLSSLSKQQQNEYLFMLAKSLNLNPWTKPFDMIVNDKGALFIYANKGCAAQIRAVHNITLTTVYEGALQLSPTLYDQRVYVVIVEASMADTKAPGGIRSVRQLGSVSIQELQGQAVQNAIMKAYTKANRRATLDLVGIGFADESEVEDFAGAKRVPDGPRRVQPKQAGPGKELPASLATEPVEATVVEAQAQMFPQPVQPPINPPISAPIPQVQAPPPPPVADVPPPPAPPVARSRFPPAVAPVGVKPAGE